MIDTRNLQHHIIQHDITTQIGKKQRVCANLCYIIMELTPKFYFSRNLGKSYSSTNS